MPTQLIKAVLIVIAISMSAWVIFRIIVNLVNINPEKKFSIKSELILLSVYIYIVAVMALTVIPLPFARLEKPNKGGINIIPGKNIIGGLVSVFYPEKTIEKEHTIENIFGNIIMFVPLGMILPLFSGKFRSLQKVTLFALICSTSIELTQLFSRLFEIYRFVDIDDVILNTSGAALGYIIVNKLFLKKRNLAEPL